jgi:hypothetical protein
MGAYYSRGQCISDELRRLEFDVDCRHLPGRTTTLLGKDIEAWEWLPLVVTDLSGPCIFIRT